MPRLKPSPDSPLAAVQRAMAQAVMRPLGARDAMRRENAPAAAAIVKPNAQSSSFERLQIYNQQYWWRLLGALAEDFRGLRAVVGERRFAKLSISYLEACGSTSWNLRDLGQHLESFLRERPELAGPHYALALDMVRVEWARVIAFDGPDRPPIDPARVARQSPARLRLQLQPYLTLLELHHPIDHLCRRLKRVEADPASNALAGAGRARRLRLQARTSAAPIYLAVHRVEFSVYYKRLEPGAWVLLQALGRGLTLEAACADAFADARESEEEMAGKIQGWFATWTRFGWLCGGAGQGRRAAAC